MDTTPEVQRSLGRIEGRLDAQDQRHNRMEETLEEQNIKLDTIVQSLAERRGGERAQRRFVALVAGAAGGVGTLAGLVLQWITGRGGPH